MKVTDLMIGDWVKLNVEGQTKPEIIKVSAFQIMEWYKDIDPIPLTLEILEKNGFVFSKTWSNEDGDVYEFVASEDVRAMVQDAEGKHTHLFLYAINYPMTIERLLVNNVHELQHALKLCKIEKEIVL